jgi:hypothetical protein
MKSNKIIYLITVLWIHTGFNAYPDPALKVNTDPDPNPDLVPDPDPGF